LRRRSGKKDPVATTIITFLFILNVDDGVFHQYTFLRRHCLHGMPPQEEKRGISLISQHFFPFPRHQQQMIELCQRRAPGFSTGSLLAPRGWTYDLASHYVVHSLTAAAARAESVGSKFGERSTAVAAHDGDRLPIGSSSNTARFECMSGEDEGSTLYLTELFVPRASLHEGAAAGVLSWDAEHMRRILLRCICSEEETRKGEGGGVAGTASNTNDREINEVWVVEVESGPDEPLNRDGAAAAGDGVTPSTSLYDALFPFFHILIEAVWVRARRKTKPLLDDAVQRIFADLKRQYHTPALKLDAFRCFTHSAAASAVAVSSTNAPSNTVVAASSNSCLAPQLHEPCTPLILADLRSSHMSSLWCTSLYSATARAFVQILLRTRATHNSATLHLDGLHTWFNLQGGVITVDSHLCDGVEENADAKAPTASALCHLLQDELRLQWEGLSVAATVPCPPGGDQEASGTSHNTVELAVATLPLDTLATPTSLYSFASVEQAWERHVAQSMAENQKCDMKREEERTIGARSLKGWKLQKLCTTLLPGVTELSAAVEEAERQQLEMDDPLLTSAERAMLYVAAHGGKPPIAPRCSTYLLRLVIDSSEECCGKPVRHLGRRQQSEGETDGKVNVGEAYVLQLHAPRVQSRHAVVVCTRAPVTLRGDESSYRTQTEVQKSDKDSSVLQPSHDDGSAVAWAATLSSAYRLASYVPSLWLPCDAGRAAVSGVCARSGRLVVHVPAGDVRYANVRLAPVPAKSFSSLGSIAAWVQGDDLNVSAALSPVERVCAVTQVGAVWTLVGDGRSAASYLEDALTEYMYDTNSKNLNNVGQPSQHPRQPGVMVVRKRQKQKVISAAASGHATAASLVGSYELCSAWVDVGATHRLLLRTRDVGVGEVLVTEASFVGPHTAGEKAGAAREVASCPAEEALEKWIEGIAASAVYQNAR
jgi:hypothetical protein